jgi:hypothetical protein
MASVSQSALDFPIVFDDASIEAALRAVEQELSRMAQTSSTYLPALHFLSAAHRVKATQTFLALQQRCEQLVSQSRTALTQWFEGMNQTLQSALSLHRALLNKRAETLERMHQAQKALSQNLSSQTTALEIFSARMVSLENCYQQTIGTINADAPRTVVTALNPATVITQLSGDASRFNASSPPTLINKTLPTQ